MKKFVCPECKEEYTYPYTPVDGCCLSHFNELMHRLRQPGEVIILLKGGNVVFGKC